MVLNNSAARLLIFNLYGYRIWKFTKISSSLAQRKNEPMKISAPYFLYNQEFWIIQFPWKNIG